MAKEFLRSKPWRRGLFLVAAVLLAASCAPRLKVRPPALSAPNPARVVSLSDLIASVNAWSKPIETLTAAVQYFPSAGSAYTGVIKHYHDVHGFILFKRPNLIRMIGQAPVVRTDIFDMVSNGQRFSLSVPPRRKFIEGSNGYHSEGKNALENIRPQHITKALLVPAIDPAREKYFREQAEADGRQYYVLDVVKPAEQEPLQLVRKLWIDRADLEISRVQIYQPDGSMIEDVRYGDYGIFGDIRYPRSITVSRPKEDYTLGIELEKVTFNTPIASDKFVLKKPAGYELIRVGEPKSAN